MNEDFRNRIEDVHPCYFRKFDQCSTLLKRLESRLEPLEPICEAIASNSTLIVSILGAIISIVNVVIAYLVYRSNVDPYVVAYLHPDAPSLFLVVENIGSSPALDVEFRMNGNIARGETCEEYFARSFVAKGIPVLMPGYPLKTMVGSIKDYPDEAENPATIEVRFKRKGICPFRTERLEYSLDWSQFSGSLSTVSSREKMESAVTKAANAHAEYLKGRTKIDDLEKAAINKLLEK